MWIVLNNNRTEFTEEELTISGLLKARNYTFKMLVIKINGQLVKKEEYDITPIRQGDDVMVLHLISGG